jgi:hypothetical protein
MSGEHTHPEYEAGDGTAPHTHPELEESPAVDAVWEAVTELQNRVAALEAGSGGGGGSLPSGTTGNLTVKGRLTILATDAAASQAIDIVVPKNLREQQAYPFIRWSLEQDNGSKTFMAGLVAHHIGTNHQDHLSLYVADDAGNRISVMDVDTFRPHSTRRFRFENLLVQLGSGSKEAVLEATKQKISGAVRTVIRDANGFLKG